MEGLCHALGHASGRILRSVASGGVSMPEMASCMTSYSHLVAEISITTISTNSKLLLSLFSPLPPGGGTLRKGARGRGTGLQLCSRGRATSTAAVGELGGPCNT